MFTINTVRQVLSSVDNCPWSATAGYRPARVMAGRPLYTQEERRRRDSSRWTLVQGFLAPVQFVVFLLSLLLVLRFLVTGQGLWIATSSIILKTAVLYAIMVTGSIWERDVFGKYLFAPAFFWEDVVSILVLALHTTYLVALFSGVVDAERQMWLALAAYASYVVNATQFLLKLRAARRQEALWPVALAGAPLGGASLGNAS